MSAVPKNESVKLRPMQEADLDRIMGIEVRAYFSPWTQGIFLDCLSVGYCCWVMEEESTIRGYSVMSVGAGEAHVLNLCVAPESQGQGLGRRLLEHMVQLAGRHGADTVFLEVRPSNTSALALYESLGFNQVGSRRGYYPAAKGREDALILALVL